MRIRKLMMFIGIALLLGAGPGWSAGSSGGYMFYGVDIDKATPQEVTQALERAGLRRTKVDARNMTGEVMHGDEFDPRSVFDGATKLRVVYLRSAQRMVSAAYDFPMVDGKSQHDRVIKLVQDRYGKPNGPTRSGGYAAATWVLSSGVEVLVYTDEIEVTRLNITHMGRLERAREEIRRVWEEKDNAVKVPHGAF